MGDTTSFQLHIYACPGGQQAAALTVVSDYDLGPEFAKDVTDGLNLTVPYFEAEVPLGFGDEIAAALIQAAPGASFYLWEDPSPSDSGPRLGSLRAYTSTLGEFTANCDQHGTPLYSGDAIVTALADATPGTDLRALIWHGTGGPWVDDYAPHRPSETGEDARDEIEAMFGPPQPGDEDYEAYDPAKGAEALAALAAARDSGALDRIAAALAGWTDDTGDSTDILAAIVRNVRNTGRPVRDSNHEQDATP